MDSNSSPAPVPALEIVALEGPSADLTTPLLVVPVVEAEEGGGATLEAVPGRLGAVIEGNLHPRDIKGKEGESQLAYPPAGESDVGRLLLVGIGKREKVDAERLRRLGGTAAKHAGRLGVDRVSLLAPFSGIEGLTPETAARALAEGVSLGAYTFDELKTRPSTEGDATPAGKLAKVEIVGRDADAAAGGARIGSILGRAANLARRLGNLPGNVATPTYLAEIAGEIAERHRLKLTVLGPTELEAEGMGALLAVSRGSDEEPRLIVLEHRRGSDDARPLVLVGKGLTFDSGGISIKPSQSMEEMKFDMCGGAAVLGAMAAIGELDLPINVVGIVPSSENMLSGSAVKPGDIIRSHLGKTIEVINTDAEGRLILADALSYARRFEPAAIVDAATLTGACVVALGNQASGLFGNDDTLLQEIRDAGTRSGERVWPLPMFDEYREQIRSDYADIKNSGGRSASAITAAWFLREFVGDTPWAHLDVAGTASGEGKLSYQTKGATGAPTRLLTEWVRARAD